MNEELIRNSISRTSEIYGSNDRSIPNAFKMHELLRLKLKRYKFGEFVAIYKNCNNGYF
jgi:hypothetical protein